MKAIKKALVAAASVAGLMAVLGTGPAAAAPIPFTWDPSATSGGALSTPSNLIGIGGGLTVPGPPIIAKSPLFSADSFGIRDYATIDITNLNNVVEHAILAVNSFSFVAPSTSAPGFVPANGGGFDSSQIGATPYQLYFIVDATSKLTANGSGGYDGFFTSLTYTLFGDQGGQCTFGVALTPNCGASGSQLVLATGGLSGMGDNEVHINNAGIPSANVDTTIVAGANAGGFFVNPTAAQIVNFAFEAAFTNTGAVQVAGPIYTINGGGGNADLVRAPVRVPEPLTLSLFGAGLAGVAALRRRRSKKA